MVLYSEQFKQHLVDTKKMASNSVTAYMRDLRNFEIFIEKRGIRDMVDVSESDVAAWLLELKRKSVSASTIGRKLASIRAFFKYLSGNGMMKVNPSIGIKTPKVTRRTIEYLNIDEVEKLLSKPDNSIKGVRDTAILEVLYATGMRVTELIGLNTGDINLRMGFVKLKNTQGKTRILPLGRLARAAVEEYLYEDRSKLLRGKSKDQKALFLNYYGERLTRQALWKLLKGYAQSSGLKKKITPQTLRNSFAVHMIQNGADLKTLQELLGHEDITATQIYLAVSKNQVKDVYDRTHPRA